MSDIGFDCYNLGPRVNKTKKTCKTNQKTSTILSNIPEWNTLNNRTRRVTVEMPDGSNQGGDMATRQVETQ